MNQFKNELTRSLESSLSMQIKPTRSKYHKPYRSSFDVMRAHDGWRVPVFYKYSGDDSKSTMEHLTMILAQMGEASTMDFMNVRL